MTVIAIERFAQVAKQDGVLSDRLAQFLEDLTRQVNLSTVLTGSGSPEGVVTASPGKLYMDTTGGAGTLLYGKQTGTGDTGWILV